MVHKKYTYKNGKKFGPYYYETKRVDGKVVTTYLGSKSPGKNKNYLLPVLFFALIGVLLLLFFTFSGFTGRASLDINADFNSGDEITGNLKLNIKSGELIPLESMVVVNFAGEEKEFLLSDLIQQETIEGDFYAENTGISGFGSGYGLIGKRKEYPEVNFDFQVYADGLDVEEDSSVDVDSESSVDSKEIDESEDEGGTDEIIDDEVEDDLDEGEVIEGEEEPVEGDGEEPVEEEIIEEELIEEPEIDESEDNSDDSSDESSDEGDSGGDSIDSAGITGGVVSLDSSNNVVSGIVSKDNDFEYELNEEETAKFVSGSVQTRGNGINDRDIDFNAKKGKVIVSTEYFIEEEGFGEDFLGDDELKLTINLDKFGFIAEDSSNFEVSLVYSDEILVSINKDISVKEDEFELNQSDEGDEIKDEDEIIANKTIKKKKIINETIIGKNITDEISINQTAINQTKLVKDVFVNTTQFGAVLGQPVKWKKRVDIKGPVNLSIEIPLIAGNVSVTTISIENNGSDDSKTKDVLANESLDVIVDEKQDEIIDEEVEDDLEGDVEEVEGGADEIIDDEIVEGEEELVEEEEVFVEEPVDEVLEEEINVGLDGNVITGKVSADIEIGNGFSLLNWFRNLFRLTGFAINEDNNNNNNNNNSQDIFVSLDESEEAVEIEYETPSPYAEEVELVNGKRIRIIGPDDVHYENVLSFTKLNESLNILGMDDVKIYWRENLSYVPIWNLSDMDGNGIYDYIEWVAPHLSNQTFDIILVIKAEHLDSNRDFVSDIFEEVRELDGNWSETIPDSHYVRATFERPLTSDRDITIFPRTVNGTPIIEVYEENGNTSIAVFENIKDNEYNKVFLDGLNGSQDVFDLRVLNGDVEFDHIIDPVDANTPWWTEGGFTSMASNPTYIDLSKEIQVNKSFILLSRRATNTGDDPDHSGVWAEWVNSTRFSLNNNVASSTVGISWYVIEGNSTYVQNGTQDFAQGSNEYDVTINPVDTSKTVVFNTFGSCDSSTVSVNNQIFFGMNVSTSTNLKMTRGSSGTCDGTVGYFVVEFNDGSTIYKDYYVMGSSSRDHFVPIGATINTSNSWLYVSQTYGATTTGLDDTGLIYEIYNSTTLKFHRQGLGGSVYLLWNVISTPGAVVQNGSTWHTSSQDEVVTIDSVVQNRSFSLAGFNSSGTGTTFSNQMYTNELDSSTALSLHRQVGATDAAVKWQTIQLPTKPVAIDQPPEVTINLPITTIYGAGDIPLSFNVSLNENGSVIYSLDNGVNNVTMIGDQDLFGTAFNGTNSSIAEGNYTFEVYANDTDGNNNYTENVTFGIDTSLPYTILNGPDNDTVFNVDVFNITLNSTVIDVQGRAIDVFIYGSNDTGSNFYDNGLIYQKLGVTNNSEITYNWTAPVISPTEDTVLLLHFDNNSLYGENDTFVSDFSNYGNNATFNVILLDNDPIPNITDGKFAGGFEFDGKGDRFDIVYTGDSLDFDDYGNYTWSMWVNLYNTTRDSYLVSKVALLNLGENGYVILVEDSGNVSIATQDLGTDDDTINQLSTTKTLTDNKFHHIAVTVNTEQDIRIYIDGIMNASGSGNLLDESGSPVYLGYAGAKSFNGTMDELAIWNRTLDAAEIKDLYRLNADKYYWKVNVTDSPGNNNESETRDFILKDTHFRVEETMNCADLLSKTIEVGQGYDCNNPGYTTCVGLNTDLNITSFGRLDLGSDCNLLFNTSSDGEYGLFLEGVLNMSGANVTANDSLNKFNFYAVDTEFSFIDSFGNITFANIAGTGDTNISDSRVNLESVDIEDNLTILNSSDISVYSIIAGGSLGRKFRLNATVQDSAGSVLSSVNVTAWNVTEDITFSLLTNAFGQVFYNLTEYLDSGSGKIYWNNYTINHTKSGYQLAGSTSLNITNDTDLSLILEVYDTIIVSSNEELFDIYSRINDETVFNNLSDSAVPCRYSSHASVNITTGKLIMEGCTLELNSTLTNGENNLYATGGILSVNNSNITSSLAEKYDFKVLTDSQFILKNSYVSNTGSSATDLTRGLAINTTSVTFENNTLFGAMTSDVEIMASNIELKNSRFIGNREGGSETEYNVYCRYCGDVKIIDSNLSGSAGAGSSVVVMGNESLYVLNSNYTTFNVQFGGRLYKQWYVDTNVSDTSNNPLNKVNINFYNNTNHLISSEITNSSGDIVRQNLSQYIVNGTDAGGFKVYQSNYTVNTSKLGYSLEEQSWNVTTNLKLAFATLDNSIPTMDLNGPINASVFALGVFNITLNSTIYDIHEDIVDSFVYGINETSTADFYKHGLLYQRINALNTTELIYNWTSPVIVPDSDTVLLLHFDNRSAYAENDTYVYDYTDFGSNGSVFGDVRPNSTGGKFAGGFEFDGLAYGDYITIGHSPLFNTVNMTIMAWIYPYGAGNKGFIVSKDDTSNGFWFSINYTSNATMFYDGTNEAVSSNANVFSRNNWSHVAVTVNASTVIFYVDGSNVGSDAGTHEISTNTNNILIGASGITPGGATDPGGFNGTMDELVIYNRTLTADEITDSFRLKEDKYFWKVNLTDNGRNSNESETRELTIPSANNGPDNPTPELNSTDGSNKTAQDLNGFDTLVDPEGDTMNVSVEWFRDGIFNFSVDYNNSYTNGTLFNATLESGNTSKGNTWIFSMRTYDGSLYSNWVNSSGLDILNTAPTIPTLSSPDDGSSVTDRTPVFEWIASTDDDDDTISYEINITCRNTAGGGCSDKGEDNRHIEELSGTSKELVGNLLYLYDNNYVYNWSMRATDLEDPSDWSGFRGLNLSALIQMSLPNSSVEFGDINFQGSNDTTNGFPLPFLLQNDGNSFVNVTIDATNLWNTVSNPGIYYKYRVDNYTYENYSFNWDLSNTTFINMPLTGSGTDLFLVELNYTNATDTAETDIYIEVPPDEGSSIRSSTVTFAASLAE